ncbi:MAG: anti-phage defense-associated sirtuin Dsr2 [Thermodesulfobacteriota bacterium]|nr:anti-phage defense-associated sirtuin Dsr2 [Thermodesulfobacteriota bacterium]
MNEIPIDESIRPYLDEIAKRLWSGHAAVMVGAGFSRNAEPSGTPCKRFPDWGRLGDLFYEKIHGRLPTGDQKYLNALKLADEVQAALGRPALDQLLRLHIPDKDYEPSPLHVRLLELPWTDVFTTNYDTLLERACASVSSQKYDVVVNPEDIVYSQKPRVVKLHGSFPSERPFIITEEDYRRYPKEFAPFVNTVQQALLENTLCLIGFSGDDPNFLQWTGWIRDNLGRGNSPKMYLVGVFSLSSAQKKLLGQRNIVLVDLGDCPGVAHNHYEALDRFCRYLLSRKTEDNRTDWPRGQTTMGPDPKKKDKSAQLGALLPEWRQARLSFPGWVVVPEDQRDSLWTFTQFWASSMSVGDKFPVPLDIQFAFELNWRLEKCLCPILNDLCPFFERVLQRYWPFADAQPPPTAEISVGQPEHAHLPWPEIRDMWVHLTLSMLRFYREEGLIEKWHAAESAVKGLAQHFSPQESAFLSYEYALQALFTLDLPELKCLLKAWSSSEALPFWETKRAALLAEIGQLEEAERILETALETIRSKLNLNPVTTDYSLVSQEAFTMLLLRLVKNSISLQAGSWLGDEEMRTQFSDRWNALKEYKCDPWNELKLFEMALGHPYSEQVEVTEKREFDIGRVTQTHHMGGWDRDALSAYAFLRFSEEVGAPFRITRVTLSKKSAEGALPRISRTSPHWAVITMIRTGDAKTVEHVFNRQALHRMETSHVDGLVDQYLRALHGCEEDIQAGDDFRTDNFGVLLAQVVPEILSRLCCKCSSGAKRKMLRFLLSVYTSSQRSKYRGIRALVERLLASLTVRERYESITTLLQFPVLGDLDPMTATELVNPFRCLSISKDAVAKIPEPELDGTRIDSLLESTNSESAGPRRWASFVLVRLYELGLLVGDQVRRLGEALWSRTDDLGLPTDTDFHRFAFLNLPHPEGIDPVPLLKEYIQKTPLPIQKQKPGGGVQITGGAVPMCKELAGSSATIQWTEKEITVILSRLMEWWDADKERLTGEGKTSPFGGAVPAEFKARFSRLVDAVADGVAPALSPETDETTRHTLSRLLSELDDAGLPSLRASAACLHLFPDRGKVVITRIEDALVSTDHDRVVDGLRAILRLLRLDSSVVSEEDMVVLLRQVSQSVMYRHITGLCPTLNTMATVIRKHPERFGDATEDLTVRGLRALADDTDPAAGIASLSFSEKLEIRQASARLAHVLFLHYNRHGDAIPSSVTVWKAICHSEKEFAEVRNEWFSNP